MHLGNNQTQSASDKPGNKVLLHLEDVRKYFPIPGTLPWSTPSGFVKAVDGVSFDISSGETLGLVGESGCGKTTTSRLILLLDKPTSGRITHKGRDINEFKGPELSAYRASMQVVFQDPTSSLSPRLRAKSIVSEPITANQRLPRSELRDRVSELLLAVGLDPMIGNSFPHELSGGMRQRVAVARALALQPSLVILDEPVSALDVSIRAQIMNLLKDLQEQYGMAYLLVAHNLATVRYLSDRVATMYAGQIVELSTSDQIFTNSLHPYTQALVSAALPVQTGDEGDRVILSGDVPSPANPPPGCRFHPRCRFRFDRCPEETPQLKERENNHFVACHLY